MSAILEQVKEQVKTLTAEERRQLRLFMDAQITPNLQDATRDAQRRLAERLLAEGLIDHLPVRYRQGYLPENDADQRPPIQVIGRPISETLLEDREPR